VHLELLGRDPLIARRQILRLARDDIDLDDIARLDAQDGLEAPVPDAPVARCSS
jgi:hypothetical protein